MNPRRTFRILVEKKQKSPQKGKRIIPRKSDILTSDFIFRRKITTNCIVFSK
jgi:hypothetical protein